MQLLHPAHNCSARLIISVLNRAHKIKLLSNSVPGKGAESGFASLPECAFLLLVGLLEWLVCCALIFLAVQNVFTGLFSIKMSLV